MTRTRKSNYEWLGSFQACQIIITHNDHHADYHTAEEELGPTAHPKYQAVAAENRRLMIDNDSIWDLTIYPDTPIGSYSFYGPTLDDVLNQARDHFRLLQWRRAREQLTGIGG